MATVILPLVIAVVGALMYALASNPKVSELGRLIFFCGFFWLVWVASGKSLRLG